MTTLLDDGDEVVLPCPETWSDSDDENGNLFAMPLDLGKQLRPEVLPACLPKEADAASRVASRPRVVGTSDSWQIERRPADSLSLAECRRDFIRRGRPLIIEGLGPHLVLPETCGLSREWLATNFGEKRVASYRNFREGRSAKEEDQSGLFLFRDILKLLRDGGEEADGLYLYDLSLPLQLPGLLEYIRLPRYFAHCYLQQTMRKHCFSKSWPTFFIGAKGTRAKLHVDQWHGHFWMHLVSGRKHWTIFHPDDAHLLGPRVLQGRHHPVFPDLADLEAGTAGAPDFDKARRIDVVLEEGETLFVPGNAPHLVVNLEDSVAFAGNFVDESNFDDAMADIAAMAKTEDAAEPSAMRGVHAALDEMDFDPDRGLHEELLPLHSLVVRYSDFAGGGAATWGPVPPGDEDEMIRSSGYL